MRRNLINLRRPLSLRDIRLVVADFQRCWLDLLAMLAYYRDYRDHVRNLQPGVGPWNVNTDLMGVFTDKDSVALTLWEAGVPVWHIRKIDALPSDLHVSKRVTMTWDLDIKTNLDDVQPLSPIHTGFGGEARAYLCQPIGNLAIGNYIPLLRSETWDDWIKRAGPPNANSAIVAETFSPSVPSTSQPFSPVLHSLSLSLSLPPQQLVWLNVLPLQSCFLPAGNPILRLYYRDW